MCSHVTAMLFKVEACVRLGIAAMTSTSLPCIWNQAFLKRYKVMFSYSETKHYAYHTGITSSSKPNTV